MPRYRSDRRQFLHASGVPLGAGCGQMQAHCLLIAAFLTALLPVPVRAERAEQPLAALVDKELPSLVALYKTIHAAPELSHYEEKTSALLARELRGLAYTVFDGIGKYDRPEWKGYGVAAVLRNGEGPVVLVRAELDALPVEEKTGLPYASKVRAKTPDGQETGVMHACGHDLHLTAMIGTARVLVALKERWRGTVVLIGQPAEETLDGAKAMLADGLYEKVPKPDYALALHDIGELEAGKVGVIPGDALASVRTVELTIRGKGGHASRPHEAKDPVVVAAQFVLAVQTVVSRENSPVDPAVVTVGSIHGGTKANVIPEEVKLLLSVRASGDEARERHIRAIERMAKNTALAAGIPEDRLPVIKPSDSELVPATYNDPALVDRVMPVFAKGIGASNVVRLKPRMAGDDFGHFGVVDGRRIPSLLFLIGVADPEKVKEARRTGVPLPPTHSPFFAPLPEPSLKTAVISMSSAILELLKE